MRAEKAIAVQNIVEAAQSEPDTTELDSLKSGIQTRDETIAGYGDLRYQQNLRISELAEDHAQALHEQAQITIRAEKAEKECNELRELLREILHADISFGDDELEKKCYLALSEPE